MSRQRADPISRFAIHARAALIPDRDEALNIVSPGKRKELRRQRRRLAEQGVLEHVVASETGDVRAALADFIDVEANSWKGRTGGAVARNPQAAAFMAEAIAALARERKVRIDRLTLNGATIAATITLFSRDYAWFWKIGYDEAYARFSPGVQIALDLTDVLKRKNHCRSSTPAPSPIIR
jgi:CelD/BcsL family acetyltransferase involved in cellulose biosynthesis